MNRIKELRKERGWTLAELERRSGVKQRTIWSLENANNAPTLPIGLRLARALGVTPEELLNDPNFPRAASTGRIDTPEVAALAS